MWPLELTEARALKIRELIYSSLSACADFCRPPCAEEKQAF